MARNVIVHCRAELPELPVERRGEIDSRWLDVILGIDQSRHAMALDRPRALTERVAGCCPDHSLLVVSALRQRDVPACTRVGFARYFVSDWANDHVIVELWHDGRWVRADRELRRPGFDFYVHDIPAGPDAPFETAAEAWLGWRAGARELSRYGVMPDSDLCGPDLVATYVVMEVAHRNGDEMLLWDAWGATEKDPPDLAEIDELARALVAADAGDELAVHRWFCPPTSASPRRPVDGPLPGGDHQYCRQRSRRSDPVRPTAQRTSQQDRGRRC